MKNRVEGLKILFKLKVNLNSHKLHYNNLKDLPKEDLNYSLYIQGNLKNHKYKILNIMDLMIIMSKLLHMKFKTLLKIML